MIDDPRVERTEERQHLFPNAYAEVTAVAVRGIERVAEVALPRMGFDVCAGGSNKWTEEVLGRGREHRKPLDGSAAHDAHEDCLGTVLELMPRSDVGRRVLARHVA